MQPDVPSALPPGLHRDALRALPAAAVITDAEHRIVFANRAFEALSGAGLAELLREGRRMPEDRDARAALDEALDRGRPVRGEVLLHRPDGTTRRSVLTVSRIEDARTTADHRIGVLEEVAVAADPTQGAVEPGAGGSGPDARQLDADLDDALDRGEIVAHFQPQYDARTGRLTGYEALARWHHPVHGTLPPDLFVPLAEADGRIVLLGAQILEQACRFADLAAAGRPLQMQVNVSVAQLRARGLADRVQRVLAAYPDRSWSLDVEITESVLMVDRGAAVAELERLRDLGVGVSIDDFGCGYSSLSQLRDLPATELKIDRSFVHDEDAVGTGLLTAIVALAAALDLRVVAEGVETRSQLARVRALGCDRVQGRYLSSPLGPEEALAARPDIADLLRTAG